MHKLIITQTEDGTPTLYNPGLGEHYHSIHGARAESEHIFIEMGLKHWLRQNTTHDTLHILEYGFGTGLNALLTLRESFGTDCNIHYTTLELYPIKAEVYNALSFPMEDFDSDTYLQTLHQAPWGIDYSLDDCKHFTLRKEEQAFEHYESESEIDLIYFDAFSPETQGELWTEEIFRRLYAKSRAGAVLTTYCAKGEVRRRLQRAGWIVERLPGPPGKREILRATKTHKQNNL